MATPEEKWSPGWRKPSEVMKMRKKKKPRKSLNGGSDKSASSTKTVSSPLRPGIVLKRRNPFGRGGSAAVVRRVCMEDSNEQQDTTETPVLGERKAASALVSHEKPPADEFEDFKDAEVLLEEEQSVSEEVVHRSTDCPVDWCLHTRIRFTSSVSFDWSSRISSAEEGHGLTNFVHGKFSDQDLRLKETASEDSHLRQRLKQSVMLWSSPSLPWFKAFPRIVPESKDAKTSFVVKEDNVQKALMTQWFESFCSAYQLVRTGICPYFYVCAHHLTILFRAKQIAGHDSIHAFLGPTTRGFRESLKAEGITFTMPLLKDEPTTHQDPHQMIDSEVFEKDNVQPASVSESDSLKPEEGNVGSRDNDTAAASWLESIGLNNVLNVNSYRGQLLADPSVKQDNRPQSVVFVEGLSNIQALYNFLLNYKNIVATVGLQAGIPPTILSPMAFHGATLTCCKVKSGCMRQIVGQHIQDIHTLEVSGPLLPHNVNLLVNLVAESQEGQFCAAFQHHEPTASFTVASLSTSQVMNQDETSNNMRRDSPTDFVDKLYRPQTVLQKAWRELKYSSGQYEWT